MRILHLVPLISPNADYGGPARGTLRQSAFTTDLGESVMVASLWPPDATEPKPNTMLGVPLVLFDVSFRVPGHKFVGMWSWSMLWWILRRGRSADVVHVHAGRELWVLACTVLLRWLRVPYVWQSHGMLAPTTSRLAGVLDRWAMGPVLRRAEIVYHLTSTEATQLRTLYGLTNLHLLINGVDAVVPSDEAPVFDRGGPLKVVVTSRLHRRKRIPELVNAVVACAHVGLDIELTIFGPDEGDLDATQAAIDAGDAGSYIAYGGPLPYERVRAELRGHHVIALTSVDEPFPNSVLEGMAQGLVPMISQSCGLAPYVAEAHAGAVVTDEDSAQTQRVLRELASDRALFEDLQQASLALTRRTFSMEGVAVALRESYRTALGDSQYAKPAREN